MVTLVIMAGPARADMLHEPLIALYRLDRLESQTGSGAGRLLWEGDLWVGRDRDKLWLKSEGFAAYDGGTEDARIEGLWSRAVTRTFDLQLGLRQDFGAGPSRTHLAAGIQGLAPYWFEIEATVYLSDDGELTARIESEYDLLLTQRLILTPRAELLFAASDDRVTGLNRGLSEAELGLRLRYEVRRQVAPYIGIDWQRAVGDAAWLERSEGKRAGSTTFVAGLRLWF